MPTAMHDNVTWQPFREPLRNTLLRTGAIALVVGAMLAWLWGGVRYWPMATLLMLWPALGGHWVEIFFLNVLRPRLAGARGVQVGVRVLVWFNGGVVLAIGMKLTATLMGQRQVDWVAWWMGGLAFIGIELVVHAVMKVRGLGNFYDGRG